LNFPGYTVAVKTGTTNDIKDNWTIGYTPSLAIGVWVGNNDNTPMSVQSGVAGAAPIFNKIMWTYLKSRPNEEFIKPDNVIGKEIDAELGGLPTGNRPRRMELFVKGTEPNSTSKYIQELEICEEDDLLASDACRDADRTDFKTFYNYIAHKESWQDAVDDWIKDNIDDNDQDKYNPPTKVSTLYFNEDGKTKDNDEPEVTFTKVKDGDTVATTFTVAVKVITPETVTGVSFYFDGAQVGNEDTSIPYEQKFELADGTNGEHKIKVVATDSAGNEGSKEIKVTVK